ncbi:hypothetical protein [uncultured Psychroserpens sp.]|uniref:hypothetical protein n=1 Tax=uncultured Psychroserpens sp. TaxID=255436 RepID=UPI002609E0B4|nr:hypothetical protein [uncultured Psychroserpens sp.]
MRKTRVKDIIIPTLILLVTFGYFLDLFIPDNLVEVDLYFFKIGSFGFPFFRNLIYFCKMKLLILMFSILWFITCRYWWKNAILVIIIIELFKLSSIFNTNIENLYVLDFIHSLPFTLPVIILLLFISNKFNYYSSSYKMSSLLDKEIDNVFFDLYSEKDLELSQLEKEILKIKKIKKVVGNKAYIDRLVTIRNKFYKTN